MRISVSRMLFPIRWRRPSRLLVESCLSLVLCVAAQSLYVSVSQPAIAGASSAPIRASSSKFTHAKCQSEAAGYLPAALPGNALQNTGLTTVIDAEHTYNVTGNSVPQIYSQIANCTPVTEQGQRYAASTYYNLTWQLSYRQTGDSCSIKNAYVGLHISVVYPTWQPTVTTPSSLSATWTRFSTNLHTHENGHVSRDKAAGAKLVSALQSLPPASCDDLTKRATAVSNAIVDELNTSNVTYDNDTDHGRTQDAVLSER